MIKDLADVFLLGLGIVCGLAFAGILGMLWVSFAGPLQEIVCERTLDRWRQTAPGGVDAPAAPSEATGLQRVLVSDPHIDTWDEADSARLNAFQEFLACVKQSPRVAEFYVNGDLMDLPLHPIEYANEPVTLVVDGNERWPGVLQEKYQTLLEVLRDLTERDDAWPVLRVCYLTGNHDIGISGIRYVRPDLTRFSAQIVWNPSVLIKAAPERWVYVEHGHRHDPFLWLYMRYAMFDLLRGGHNRRERQVLEGLQRGGKVGMNTQPQVRGEVAPAAPASALSDPPKKESFRVKMARYRYRQAARATFRQTHRHYGPQVRTVIFGHTHIPDRYEFPGGLVYINAGDWAGNTPHQSYVVIDSDGAVTGPHQWQGRAGAEFVVAGSA